jgi:hypothetical protein
MWQTLSNLVLQMVSLVIAAELTVTPPIMAQNGGGRVCIV